MSAYKPSLIEKETIILFNEAESEAEIYTYNQKLINRLKKHPAIVNNLFSSQFIYSLCG